MRWVVAVWVLAAKTLAGLCVASTAVGQEPATFVLGVTQGSSLTNTVQTIEGGGYELSDGTPVSFVRWYHTDWVDVRIDMLTQLSDNFGILWGGSTGERGQKFNIDPSIKLGVIAQQQPTQNSTISLSVTTILGGQLAEFPCVADYGDIGGKQPVNCRLAASFLAPNETLKYLLNAAPSRLNISLSYSASF